MRALVLSTLLLSLSLAGCAQESEANTNAAADVEGLAKATFAGGCFWCMEPPFDVLDGVISTTSGYIAGHVKNPTYQQVSAGSTGHTEAVEIVFDPAKISYE